MILSPLIFILITWPMYGVLINLHHYMVTCSTTDAASETIALRENDMAFIFFVYVAPIARIRGTTRKESIATSQQLANAIIIPAKKVEKLATK